MGSWTSRIVLLSIACLFPVAAEPKDPDRAALEKLLEQVRQKYDLPALAAAVISGDKPLRSAAVGVREYGKPDPVTLQDQFHLGSCTKALTGTLAGLLVERRKLRWDLTLEEVFPAWKEKMDPGYRKVTLDQLLTHRAGLPHDFPKGKEWKDLYQLKGEPRAQRVTYAQWLLAEPPEFPPGSKMSYSNAGYCIAAAMAEAVTDRSWESMVQEELFTPLGMETAGFGAMGAKDTLDQPRQHKFDGKRHEVILPGPFGDNPPVLGPAATVHCAVGDWAKFIALQLTGAAGGKTLLSPETLRALHTPAKGTGYARGGWMVAVRDWAGGPALNHAGSNTMNYALCWIAPQRKLAILVMTNEAGEKRDLACDEVVTLLLRELNPR